MGIHPISQTRAITAFEAVIAREMVREMVLR